MSDARMAAPPSRLELDSKVYLVSEFGDGDWAAFEKWCQDRCLRIAFRNMDALKQADRDTLLTAAYRQAALMTAQSPELHAQTRSLEGTAYIMFLALRREQPTITEAEAEAFAYRPEVVKQIFDILFPPHPAPSEEEAKKKSARGKTRKS